VKIQQLIENHWYLEDKSIIRLLLNILLTPFSLAFYLISKTRHFYYKIGIFKSYKLPVPVVIIGNITVGGSGKTPLAKHIVKELTKHNIKAGVILRGYKSKVDKATIVKKGDDPEITGDEALIYANNNIPVAIGRNRYLAGLKLLEEYPNIQLILSDDGMQHYRLKRDYEIAVIDGTRILGNRFILPNGPLRETAGRLEKVDALVVNSQEKIKDNWFYTNLKLKLSATNLENQLRLGQKLTLQRIYNPITAETLNINDLIENKLGLVNQLSSQQRQESITLQPANINIAAIAAIGNPERFFNFITNNGIKLTHTISFPDHYSYLHHDIPTNYDIILTSEKDYTKLAKFNNEKIWIVEVESVLSSTDLITNIINLIKEKQHARHETLRNSSLPRM